MPYTRDRRALTFFCSTLLVVAIPSLQVSESQSLGVQVQAKEAGSDIDTMTCRELREYARSLQTRVRELEAALDAFAQIDDEKTADRGRSSEFRDHSIDGPAKSPVAPPANPTDLAIGAGLISLVDARDSSHDLATELPRRDGLLVLSVLPESPAAKAGLQPLDVIVQINNTGIESYSDLYAWLRQTTRNRTSSIKVLRPDRKSPRVKWDVRVFEIVPRTLVAVMRDALHDEYDAIAEHTTYSHEDSPRAVNSRSDMSLWFRSSRSGISELQLHLQYVANDWLFVQQVILKGDNDPIEFRPGINGMRRDNGGGRIWEWTDFTLSDPEPLKELLNSDEVTLRLVGVDYFKDRLLTDVELERMRFVLNAYELIRQSQ